MIDVAILIAALAAQVTGHLSVNLAAIFILALVTSYAKFCHFARMEEIKAEKPPAPITQDLTLTGEEFRLLQDVAGGTQANTEALQAILQYIQALPTTSPQ